MPLLMLASGASNGARSGARASRAAAARRACMPPRPRPCSRSRCPGRMRGFSTEHIVVRVPDMHCSSCTRRIEASLAEVAGVERVAANLSSKSVHVDIDDAVLGPRAVVSELSAMGYTASTDMSASELFREAARKQLANAGVATAVSLPFFLLPVDLPGWQQLLLTLPGLYASRAIFRSAYKLAGRGKTSMDTLVSLGVGASLAHGLYGLLSGMPPGCLHFECAATVMAIINIGRYLESRVTSAASARLSAILERKSTPERVLVRDPDTQAIREGHLHGLKRGDTVVVRPGEMIPVDGVVTSGSGWTDESALTGESNPVAKFSGDEVTAGTVSLPAPDWGPGHSERSVAAMDVRAERVGRATVYNSILRQLSRLSGAKTSIQRTADRISGVFVPGVLGLSGVTLAAWSAMGDPRQGLDSAIAVLVGACPCALGIAAPSAIQVSSGEAAKRGIIFQSPSSLEASSGLTTICFDKTGTLTDSKLRVESVHILGSSGYSEPEVVRIAASLGELSSHPLDEAVHRYWSDMHSSEALFEVDVDGFKYEPGVGISGVVEGKRVSVGALPSPVSELESLRPKGHRVYVSIEGEVVAIFFFKEKLKDEALATVQWLRQQHKTVYILSGDRQSSVTAIGKQLGLEEDFCKGGLSAFEKAEFVQSLGGGVGFVGDGVNDVLSLAASDVGFGISVKDNSSAAVEASDVALIGSRIDRVQIALTISTDTMHIINQNMLIAFGYNAIVLPMTVMGMLPPTESSITHTFSTFAVVANSLRLRR